MHRIKTAMENIGVVADTLYADGKIHRCRSAAKDRKNKDAWYIIHEHADKYYAVCGCWVTNMKQKINLNGDGGEDKKIWKRIDAIRKEAETDRIEAAKIKAANFFYKLPASSADHPYLKAKGVKVWGDVRICNNAIIIPVLNARGEITSYQAILANGVKKFLYSGVVAGGCFPIPGDDKIIYICEGYATGATIREATGYKVLVAFNAGNLEAVTAQALKLFKKQEIIICADNDHKTAARIGKNPGILAAEKIKKAYGIEFLYPTGIAGSDFNDMASELGLDAVKTALSAQTIVECIEQEDCQDIDDSLVIPADLPLSGLIAQGLDALEGDIIQYSLPLVLTIISRAIAGKISINGVHPNIFSVKVGGTSTGKTSCDNKFMTCLNIPDFISMNDAASGPGIWRAVSLNPRGMGLFDEITGLFLRNNAKGGMDLIAEGKILALMDLYSRSGQAFKKVFGDVKNAIEINFPCVSILGNATPNIFDSIKLKDFESGLMQRFDFWVYDGKIKPKELVIGSGYMQKTQAWLTELRKLMDNRPEAETIGTLISETVDIQADAGTLKKIKEFSTQIIEEANHAESAGQVGFITRQFDAALKYAMIYHAATNGAEGLYRPMCNGAFDFGVRMAALLSNWKTQRLAGKVTSGDFHQDCEIFKGAILKATRQGRRATFAYMATRVSNLKNWQPRYSQMIIDVLRKRGEIMLEEGRGATIYKLIKASVQGE